MNQPHILRPRTERVFKCRDCGTYTQISLDCLYAPSETMVLNLARNQLSIIPCKTEDERHRYLIEVHDRKPMQRLAPPTPPQQGTTMKHQHGEGTHVQNGSSRLEATREHSSENYHRYVITLPDGTSLKVWVPRLDFRHAVAENAEIVIYQNREAKRPHPINLDDAELASVTKKTRRKSVHSTGSLGRK